MFKTGRILFILCSLFFCGNLYAQSLDKGLITGSLIAKSNNKPLEYATVALHKLADSSFVSGTMTDTDGKFFFDRIDFGNYYLFFSRIGFSESKSSSFSISATHPKQVINKFALNEVSLPADDIIVTAEKPTFNIAIDRKVYDTEKDIASKSGSASDLLQNVPSVSVDIDGNVSLRGSENVLILINGRSSPLMGKNRAIVLQQMPANSIEKIEIITNPSAKYKPEGTSGIINLVLKKNSQYGLNGSTTTNIAMDSRYNGNITLNYNPGRFNLFGSYGLRKDYRNRYNKDNRLYFSQDSLTNRYFNENDRAYGRPLSHIASLGIDFNPAGKNQLGISGDYYYRDVTQRETARNILTDINSIVTSDYIRSRLAYSKEYENDATAYYEHLFDGEDHTLRIQYDYSEQPEKEDNHYTNTFFIPQQPEQYNNILAKQGESQNQLAIEYANPLSEKSKLEAGFEFEFNKQDINNIAELFDTTSQVFVADTSLTNHFRFDETISAIYSTFEHSFGKISFLAGLRYEYAHNKSDLITTNTIINNSYSNFYPSFHLGYEIGKNSELQLNYSRRINRPERDDLNPFPEYRDPLNIVAGNPKLLPEYIHSIELGWQKRTEHISVTPSVYYRYKYNGFTSVTVPLRDSILLTTRTNLSHDQSTGLELIVNGSIGTYLDVDVSLNAFNNTIDASNLGFSSKKSVTSGSGNFNINLKLRPTTIFQINSYYRSSMLTPQGKRLASFTANFGVRQDLFNDRLSLILTASDIFKTRVMKTQIRTLWLNSDSESRRDSQLVFLGATYRFGQVIKKNEKKSLEYDSQ